MLIVVVNFHGIADCAPSCVNVEDRKRLQTVNARNSIIIRSRLLAVDNCGVFERTLCGILTGPGISLKACLFLDITSHIFVVSCRFVRRLHAFPCIDIELIWTVDANNPVIKRFFWRAQSVSLLGLVQLEDLYSLRNDSG